MSDPQNGMHGTIYDSFSGATDGVEYFDYKGKGYFHHTDFYREYNWRFSYDHDGFGNVKDAHSTNQANNTHYDVPDWLRG